MRENGIKPLERGTLEFEDVTPHDELWGVLEEEQSTNPWSMESLLNDFVKEQTGKELVSVDGLTMDMPRPDEGGGIDVTIRYYYP